MLKFLLRDGSLKLSFQIRNTEKGNRFFIEGIEKEIRKAHIKRVSNQQCDVMSGLYYIDIISHFTRIGDHARNLVEKMIENKGN